MGLPKGFITPSNESVHSFGESSFGGSLVVANPELTLTSHCSHGSLTNAFGWFVQGVLAALAFTCLILKRFCEPRRERRPWMIWFYDTSKQGMGALVIHFANIFLAEFFQGDPCTWYIISFLLDSSIGLFLIFIGIRLTQHIARKKGWDHLVFGEYAGKPPYVNAWLSQCAVYITLMLIEKLLITLLIQLDIWDKVSRLIMWPIKDPRVEVAIVVLVIPFIINVIMFWVVDNFLMHKPGKWKETSPTTKRCAHYKQERNSSSEAEILLLSGEDEGFMQEQVGCQQRHHGGTSLTPSCRNGILGIV